MSRSRCLCRRALRRRSALARRPALLEAGIVVLAGGLAALPQVVLAQGVDAAARRVEAYRELTRDLAYLRALAARTGTRVDFASRRELKKSLTRAAERVGMADGLGASIRSVAGGAPSDASDTATACMAGWAAADPVDLLPCYLRVRDQVRGAARVVRLMLDADAREREGTTCEGACGAPWIFEPPPDPLVPLFSLGSQLSWVQKDGETSKVLLPTLSMTAPTTLLATLLGTFVGDSPITKYLSDRVSLDLAFFTQASTAEVLSGVSVGLPRFSLGDAWDASLSAFVRSVPRAALDSAFLAASAEDDPDQDRHATFGLRLTLFPRGSGESGFWGDLSRRFFLALEVTGPWVAQGEALTVLKDVFTAQDPHFRRNKAQYALGVGFWFFGPVPGD